MLQRNLDSGITHQSYRPDIDGLRAIAVLSVMANHYGATWLPGGFTGVDVFFVISGYLITRGLVLEISAGGNWLGRFYERRLKRVLPALATVCLFTFIGGYLILMPGDFASLGASSAYSAFGVGNYYFYWNTGYFDRAAELQPLLHLWSLGVEEQFYFVWPIVLSVLLKFPGRNIVRIAVGSIILVSLYAAEQKMTIDPKAAFYLPFFRAWELAAGAALVFVPAVKSRQISTLSIAAGLSAIGFSLFFVSSQQPFPGIAALPAVVGAALLVLNKEPVPFGAVLTNRPMVQIGLVSYSLYLWHWPIWVLYRHYIGGALPNYAEVVGLAIISFVLAYLTWRYIEPLRKLRLSMPMTICAGLCVSFLVAGIGSGIRLSDGFAGRSQSGRAFSSLNEMWTWTGCRKDEHVEDLVMSSCVFGANWDKATSRGLVWGDSHAEHFAPIIEAVLPKNVSAGLVVPCPGILGNRVKRIWLDEPNYVQQCKAEQDRVVDIINSGEVDWVVLAAAWAPLSENVSQDGSLPSSLDGVGLIEQGTRDLLARINSRVKITIVGQSPGNAIDPAPCALNLLRKQCGEQAELAAAFTKQKIGPLDAMFDHLAEEGRFQFVSPASKLCANGRCDPIFEGEPLYRDINHLRRNLPSNVRADLARKIGLDHIF